MLKKTPERGYAPVDASAAGHVECGPPVNDWLAFLAERITEEFLRELEGRSA